MSVICKVYISSIRDLGAKKLVQAQCVAENEVMAAYNPDAEDKLFSQYSPSGSAEFVVENYVALPQGLGTYQDKLYLFFVRATERPKFDKALTIANLMVRSVTDFGGTSKQFDLVANYNTLDCKPPQTGQFAHRIMIDNPKASEQFAPQQNDWWVAVYDATKLSMSEVLADGHA